MANVCRAVTHPPVTQSCVAGGWCVEGLGCPFVSSCGLFLPAEGVVEDVEDAEEEEGIARPGEVAVVFLYFVEEHVGGDVEGEPVAEEGEDGGLTMLTGPPVAPCVAKWLILGISMPSM